MITQPLTEAIRLRELAVFDLHPTDPRPARGVLRESGTEYDAGPSSGDHPANGSDSPEESVPTSTDLLNSACESGLESLGLDLTQAGTVHGWLTKLNSDGNRVRLMFIDLLRKLYEDRMYVECGYTTFRHYCDTELGLARSTAYEYVHTSVALACLPGIRTGFKDGALSWEQVRAMARVATPETEREWIELALKAPTAELFAKLRSARAERRTSPEDRRFGLPNLNVKVTLRMTVEEKQRLRSAQAILAADMDAAIGDRPPPGRVEDDPGRSDGAEGSLQGTLMRLVDGILAGDLRVVSAAQAAAATADRADEPSEAGDTQDSEEAKATAKRTRARRAEILRANAVVYHVYPETERAYVETDGGRIAVSPERVAEIAGSADTVEIGPEDMVEVTVLPRGETDAPTSASLVKKILARDGFRCQNPGCRCRHNLQVHHIIWRSEGGPTVANNLITLCARCHSMIHHRLLSVVGTLATGLVWTRHPADETVELRQPGATLRRIEAAIAAAPMPHDPSVSPWPGNVAGTGGSGIEPDGPGVGALRAIELDRLEQLKDLMVGLGVRRGDAEAQLGKILEALVPPERLRGPDVGSVIPDDEAIVRAVLQQHGQTVGGVKDFPAPSDAKADAKADAKSDAGDLPPDDGDSDPDIPHGNGNPSDVDS